MRPNKAGPVASTASALRQNGIPQTFPIFALAGSAGALQAMKRILSKLPDDFPGAVIVLRHRTEAVPNYSVEVLQGGCALKVKEAEEGELLRPGMVYVARPGIHLLVTRGSTFHLSAGPKVHFVRPSADCLFDSMAVHLRSRAVAIILSGYDANGSGCLKAIRENGGIVIVQSTETAQFPGMPSAAIKTHEVDYIAEPDLIPAIMCALARGGVQKHP